MPSSANIIPTSFGATATPASTLAAALDTMILSVTGWTAANAALVSGTSTWNVYKSAAANNSFGSDFYVAIGWNTATPTSIFLTVFEQWNSTTHLATNFPPNTAQIPVAVTFANPNAAAALPSTGTTMHYLASGAAFTTVNPVTYVAGCTPDRIWWGTNNVAVNEGFYAGLYESANAISLDPFPLVCVKLGGTGSSNSGSGVTNPAAAMPGLATREPGQTASSAINFSVGCGGSISNSWTLVINSIDTYSGKYYVGRAAVFGRSSSGFRGLLKDVYMGPLQTQNADTVTWTLSAVNHTSYRLGGGAVGVYGDAV